MRFVLFLSLVYWDILVSLVFRKGGYDLWFILLLKLLTGCTSWGATKSEEGLGGKRSGRESDAVEPRSRLYSTDLNLKLVQLLPLTGPHNELICRVLCTGFLLVFSLTLYRLTIYIVNNTGQLPKTPGASWVTSFHFAGCVVNRSLWKEFTEGTRTIWFELKNCSSISVFIHFFKIASFGRHSIWFYLRSLKYYPLPAVARWTGPCCWIIVFLSMQDLWLPPWRAYTQFWPKPSHHQR